MLNETNKHLIGKPSLKSDYCVVCGARATNQHHVIQKGMGGSKAKIPTVSLCGMGNTSGCHKLAHEGKLHFYWFDEEYELIARPDDGEAVTVCKHEEHGWKMCLLPDGLPTGSYNLQYALENGEWVPCS